MNAIALLIMPEKVDTNPTWVKLPSHKVTRPDYLISSLIGDYIIVLEYKYEIGYACPLICHVFDLHQNLWRKPQILGEIPKLQNSVGGMSMNTFSQNQAIVLIQHNHHYRPLINMALIVTLTTTHESKLCSSL